MGKTPGSKPRKKQDNKYKTDEQNHEEDEVSLSENNEDEYDQEANSEDDDFIADDETVEKEYIEQQKRERKKLKKKQKRHRESSQELDDEDFEIIQKIKTGGRKLKKVGDINDSDDNIEANQIPVKSEQLDKKRSNDLIKKQQIFEKRVDSNAPEDGLDAQMNQVQTLKDKFVTEDIDDLFGTERDLEIAEQDIPERLQIKLSERFNPDKKEIDDEATWIFDNHINSLSASRDMILVQKIQDIKIKIQQVIEYIRCMNYDVPYITRYKMHDLSPELEPRDVWFIFNIDIEYGKFQIQKTQCEQFFNKLEELLDSRELNHYKNHISYAVSQRDLNDMQPLIDFYKSFYQPELDKVFNQERKKLLPVPKKDFVFTARKNRLDVFSKKCLLNPIQLVENIREDQKQLHKPPQPSSTGPTEMAKEFMTSQAEPLDVIKEMCTYSAIELQSSPEIRKSFKQHIYKYGVIQTEPTEKGKKELDIFHPCYRVKRLQKELKDLENSDIFLDILQNERLGLIKYKIEINDHCQNERVGNKFFQKLLDNYQYPGDVSKWRYIRLEIIEYFNGQINSMNRGQKSFLNSILDDIKTELKEDAENHVLRECGENYSEQIRNGYFKIKGDQFHERQIEDNNPNRHINEYIPQRERLVVMGACIYQIDQRNYQTTIAVVDQYGELVQQKDFLYILPPRKPRPPREGQPEQRFNTQNNIDQQQNHEADKQAFQEILKSYKVDLIVVSADCLEARRLKKTLGEFANFRGPQDPDDDNNQPMMDQNDEDGDNKQAIVIWGKPEIPKLFACSHYSQKLLKNHPFILKKAICLARYEQDPMNEILNLWSPIMSENQALQMNLHPLQKHINQARLCDVLEEINIQIVNEIGVDLNLLVDHEHWHNQFQFLSGLGPRKAQKFIHRLKTLGRPIIDREQLFKDKFLGKNMLRQSNGFVKLRVPKEKRTEDIANVLDQTRIHHKDYTFAYKLIVDYKFGDQDGAVEDNKKVQALIELIKRPEENKLKEWLKTNQDYRERIRKMGKLEKSEQIASDLEAPFKDFREQKGVARTMNEPKFNSKELFYCLIDETERTFKQGMIVSATIVRVYNQNQSQKPRILCRLENGVEANIYQDDADFFASDQVNVDQGSIVTGRIEQLKFDKELNENFRINLKCKQQHLEYHDPHYIEELEAQLNCKIHDDDKKNFNFLQQEQQTQQLKKSQIQKRKIQHQRFQNISSTQAIEYLKKEDNGEFYFRPSSRGTDHLTLTWKFYETNIVHIDIVEHDKAIGANIGSRLRISDENYENLQEIVERYITPCNRSLRDVTQHPKFFKCSNKSQLEEVQKCLENEKAQDNSRIPYKFTILDKYPQFIILAYIPKKEMVKEFIKVKPRGYSFHNQYHFPFQILINWFKENFRSKDYQKYLRRAQSPQLVTGHGQRAMQGNNPADNPSNRPIVESQTGMQINQDENQPMKPDWGVQNANQGDEQKFKASSWGAGGGHDSRQKDEEPRSERRDRGGGGERGRGGFGRGRGGRDDRGAGGDGGPPGGNKCYNCQGFGHFARECTEQKKERPPRDFNNNEDRGPYKRRRDNEGGDFNNGNNGGGGATKGGPGGWSNEQNEGERSSWNQKKNEGNQWGGEGADAGRPSQNASQGAAGGWGGGTTTQGGQNADSQNNTAGGWGDN